MSFSQMLLVCFQLPSQLGVGRRVAFLVELASRVGADEKSRPGLTDHERRRSPTGRRGEAADLLHARLAADVEQRAAEQELQGDDPCHQRRGLVGRRHRRGNQQAHDHGGDAAHGRVEERALQHRREIRLEKCGPFWRATAAKAKIVVCTTTKG